jgi:hypothetical protein
MGSSEHEDAEESSSDGSEDDASEDDSGSVTEALEPSKVFSSQFKTWHFYTLHHRIKCL